jgi:uncharacterized membrane protein YeaQ/YmgE (transglycosylase-associated protein family)
VLQYLWMFIIGIVAGAIARLIMPGPQHMGIIVTGILGIVGSFVGGFITRLFKKPQEGGVSFQRAGIALSVVGAVIVLFIVEKVVG